MWVAEGRWALLWSLLPFRGAWSCAMTGGREEGVSDSEMQWSLRKMAEKKIHHGRGKFLNPFSTTRHGNIRRLLRWKLFSRNRFKSYYGDEPFAPVNLDWGPIKRHKGCSVTFVKHACLMIKDLDRYLLVDPMFFRLMWFHDFSPIAFDIKEMPAPDHILITHGHYDHLDKSSLRVFDRDSHVISPLGYTSEFEDLGMGNRAELDWFDAYGDGEREIILLPCNHWTMRNPFVGPNDSLWGSYLVKGTGGYNLYISGDSAYFDRFKEIGEAFPIDLAIFNLGAYEPRWFMAASHLNPAETVKAFQDLNAKKLMIVHWGTYRLGDEPVRFPPMEIKREMEKHGILDRLVHLEHGETHYLS